MDEFYNKTTEETLKILKVTKNGLTDKDVEERRKEQGYNELVEGKKKSIIRVFFDQFKDFLVIILIIASIVSAFLGKLESTIVILVVILLNAILGTIQHVKAEQSLNSLKALSSPVAKVIRNGKKIEIPSKEIVIGDMLVLDAGDFVSADGRIIECFNLQVNESSLTGESESVLKKEDVINGNDVGIGDRINMVFSGSFVTYGRAVIVVTLIGMKTEIGKIANLLENAEEKKTPLQRGLDDFGKKLAIVILIISAIILILNIIRGNTIVDSFMFAVSLAVAAIPEALSSIVTIVLAIGTQKMAKSNAIVRKLHSVESLGGISVICSDKTGTLTQNKMTVKKIFVNNKIINFDELNYDNPVEKSLAITSLLCNDAVTTENKSIGDPTEIALVDLGTHYNVDEMRVRGEFPRVGELPFDSDRKLMSTINIVDNKKYIFTKGALDVIIDRCVSNETNSGIESLNEEVKNKIRDVNKEFSGNALRVLAFAYNEFDKSEVNLSDENNLIFLGLIAMIDPPRVESAKAVGECINAGIKPVMITGDHKITASAIAKEIGILKDISESMEGSQLDNMSDEELRGIVENISVYARVSPEHKIRIVKAWQDNGNVVAMTGDGVNDAPALKQADIGIAMGITGTEVSKDAASIILADDNFSTIVKAVSNGRSIYENIKNSIKFLLSGNTAGILAVLYTSLLALPNPFAPLHLLFINLVTDSLPAIAIGLEPYNKDIMKEKPRDIHEPLLGKSFAVEIIIEGIIIGIVTIVAFYKGLNEGGTLIASTMAFSTLCLARLTHGFNSRSKKSIFKIGIFSNIFVWISLAIGMGLLLLILKIPVLMRIFEVGMLNTNQLITIGILSVIPLIIIQIYKLIFIK